MMLLRQSDRRRVATPPAAALSPAPFRPGRQALLASPLLVILVALSACKEKAQASAEPAAAPVRVENVRLVAASSIARYPGVVRPRVEAEIGFRVGGKVVERYVDVGDRVEAGTRLARLDPADLELQVRAVEAQLVSARADAANARDDFARYAELHKDGWVARQDYDKHKAVMETNEARVRQFEAQLRAARNNANYALLVADGPGVVTAVTVEPGQVVAQGQPMFRIARAGEMEVAADIPEPQIGRIARAELSVELWSMPGHAIPARLREISPSADPATRTYRARVTLAEPPPGVQLGMTATLVATQRRDERVAELPLAALTQDKDAPAVWVLNPDGDGVVLRPVRIGRYTGDQVTVLAGLNEGERVVTAGAHKLYASQKVRVWTEPVR